MPLRSLKPKLEPKRATVVLRMSPWLNRQLKQKNPSLSCLHQQTPKPVDDCEEEALSRSGKRRLIHEKPLLKLCVVQLSKVVPHCRQSQCLGKLVVMVYQRSSKEAPELFALTINYSKPDHHTRECRHSAEQIIALRLDKLLRRSFHRVKRPLIILTWGVDGPHDRLIALNQPNWIHSGLEIQGALGIVSGRFRQ